MRRGPVDIERVPLCFPNENEMLPLAGQDTRPCMKRGIGPVDARFGGPEADHNHVARLAQHEFRLPCSPSSSDHVTRYVYLSFFVLVFIGQMIYGAQYLTNLIRFAIPLEF